jgi:two-component system cell cycle sensor histidine kinase/response regulator CckA
VEVYQQKKDEIDLVLLDLVMPRLGGAGCFEQLKEVNPNVKVVLMSGFTRNHRVNDLMESGCLFFLRKPFELTDLLAITREVTRGKEE